MRSTEPRGWSLRTRLAWQLVLAIGLLLGGLFLVLDVLVDRAMYRQLDQFLLTYVLPHNAAWHQAVQRGDRQALFSLRLHIAEAAARARRKPGAREQWLAWMLLRCALLLPRRTF